MFELVNLSTYYKSAQHLQEQKQNVYSPVILRKEFKGGAGGLPIWIGSDTDLF